MAITERDRRDLFDTLEEALGPDQAETLMHLLPKQPADELVTIAYFQTEMNAYRAEMRLEFGVLRSELKGEMGELRSELRGEMSELRTELTGELTDLKGTVLGIENSMTSRMADIQLSMNRWAIGLATANVIGIVTAIAT